MTTFYTIVDQQSTVTIVAKQGNVLDNAMTGTISHTHIAISAMLLVRKKLDSLMMQDPGNAESYTVTLIDQEEHRETVYTGERYPDVGYSIGQNREIAPLGAYVGDVSTDCDVYGLYVEYRSALNIYTARIYSFLGNVGIPVLEVSQESDQQYDAIESAITDIREADQEWDNDLEADQEWDNDLEADQEWDNDLDDDSDNEDLD